MPEWLTASFGAGPAVVPQVVLLRLVGALILGGLVAGVYKFTQPADEITPSFPTTLVLLSILIAMVTQVVGDNVARAFSLVGALSIVRFRTVVRDTEDTAYVIFAVVVGMAIGAGAPWVAVIGLTIVALAAVLMMPRDARAAAASAHAYVLQIRAALGHDLQTLAGPALDAHLSDRRLVSIGTAKQGLSLEVVYDVHFRAGKSPDSLVRDLNRIEGMQSVEVRARELD